MNRGIVLIATLFAVACAVACGGDDAPPDESTNMNDPDAGDSGGPDFVTFSDVFAAVKIGPTCGGPACHSAPIGGELLMPSAAVAYDNLIEQPAAGALCADVGLNRVEPGSPDESLFYLKLTEDFPCGDRMPPAGPLDAATIDLVRQWIADGAREQ